MSLEYSLQTSTCSDHNPNSNPFSQEINRKRVHQKIKKIKKNILTQVKRDKTRCFHVVHHTILRCRNANRADIEFKSAHWLLFCCFPAFIAPVMIFQFLFYFFLLFLVFIYCLILGELVRTIAPSTPTYLHSYIRYFNKLKGIK